MFAGDIHLIYADSDVGNIESRLSVDLLIIIIIIIILFI